MQILMRTSLLVLISLFVFGCGSTEKSNNPVAVGAVFDSLDVNGDGSIDENELGVESEDFTKLDTDGDGTLSSGEFAKLDTNGDGILSNEELGTPA